MFFEVEAVGNNGGVSRLSRPLSELTLPYGRLSYITSSIISSFRVTEINGNDSSTVWRLEASGSVIVKKGVNPSFDLSGFSGYKYFSVIDNSFTELNLESSSITNIDVSAMENLTDLGLFDNSITELNIYNNEKLERVYLDENDLSTRSKDGVFAALSNAGLSNGVLHIDSGRSSDSDADKASLISRGWSITEF